MTKAVVTGGAGFIGSHLVDRLVDMGLDVTIIDDLSTGSQDQANPRARLIKGSLTERALVQTEMAEAEYVFHFAALPRIQPSFDDPLGHEEANVIGTINCLQALKDSKHLKKIVVSSSSACYGNPDQLPTPETAPIDCLSPYALQKYASEQYALILGQRFATPVISLRYFNVYGPRSFNARNPFNAYSSVVGIFQNQHQNGKTLTITGDGSQSRDFVHVYDVVEANLVAAFSELAGDVFNVGYGKAYTVLDTARLFADNYEFIPERKGEPRITLAAIDKIKTAFGWSPTIDLESGVKLLEE